MVLVQATWLKLDGWESAICHFCSKLDINKQHLNQNQEQTQYACSKEITWTVKTSFYIKNDDNDDDDNDDDDDDVNEDDDEDDEDDDDDDGDGDGDGDDDDDDDDDDCDDACRS